MNKFATLFVLSLFMLGMQNNAMEKHDHKNENKVCWKCFFENHKSNIDIFTKKSIYWTNFFEHHNNEENNLAKNKDKDNIQKNETKFYDSLQGLKKILNKNSKLPQKVDVTAHMIKLNNKHPKQTKNEILLNLRVIRNAFNIKIQKCFFYSKKNIIIMLTYFDNPTLLSQISFAYNFIGEFSNYLGIRYGKNKVNKYNCKEDQIKILTNSIKGPSSENNTEEFYIILQKFDN